MIDMLSKLSQRYYLQLGDYQYSPVMKMTSGIALDYCKKLVENRCQKEPFYFCFPEKKAAALWTSIAILTNYYLADYINIELEGIPFKKGEKVQIYGCVAEIERISIDDTITLRFKDQGGLQLNKKLRSQLSYAKPTRALNLLKKYKLASKTAKSNRNPISKILEPNTNALINQRNLKSKVLLVAGRGQTKVLHDFLEVEIYGERLAEVFPERKNLIITADLKPYHNCLNSGGKEREADFINYLNKAEIIIEIKEVRNIIRRLIELYQDKEGISQEFEDKYLNLIRDFEEEVPKLKFLHSKYPGIYEDLPQNVRAVVLNDITQILDYPSTIKSFLSRNIPVIVISNRLVLHSKDINFYSQLFKDNPNSYRLNWNRKKIDSVLPDLEVNDYLDQLLWDQCIRFKNQDLYVGIAAGNELDVLGPKILNHMKSLDEFEVLQKSFYKYMYPALYALKNSKYTNNSVRALIQEFKNTFSLVSNQIPNEMVVDFNNTINIAETYEENSKCISYEKGTFALSVPLEFNENFIIPTDVTITNIPDTKTEKLLFTGYPFNEYTGKYLLNSVCSYFVPHIHIECWPIEGSLTYNYLRRRIKAGYFTDNFTDDIYFDPSFMLCSNTDIENEIDTFLHHDAFDKNDLEPEEGLAYLHQFKYNGYYSGSDSLDNWKVNCDVLNFDDGSFMFLPKGSSILCQTEDIYGKPKVLKKSADQFFIGDLIFRYVKDRGVYFEISMRDKKVSKSYVDLKYWRDKLQSLYRDTDQNIKGLENLLMKTKQDFDLSGNPIKSSIERWLFDEEIIKPDNDNLRIIFYASRIDEIEERIKMLENAYKIATSHRISLSSKIKKKISKEISNRPLMNKGFQIKLNGEFIDVETRLVSSVDRNGIEVDYRNTRKILC